MSDYTSKGITVRVVGTHFDVSGKHAGLFIRGEASPGTTASDIYSIFCKEKAAYSEK